MNSLTQRIGIAIAFLSVALVTACGGGGGGGGTPPTAPPTGPTSTPTGAAPQSTTVAVSPGSGSIATVAAGSATASVQMPGTASGSATMNVIGYGALPSNIGTFARRAASLHAFASTNAIVACVAIEATNSSANFAATPTFTFTLPSSVTTTGTTFMVAMYQTQPNNGPSSWIVPVAGPAAINGQVLIVQGASRSITMYQGLATYYCLYVPAATPAPSPTASPTTFANGGTLNINLTGLRSASVAATVAINATPLPTVALPANCAPACTISVTAPPGSNESVSVSVSSNANGGGVPLGYGTTTAPSVVAGNTTTVSDAIVPVMASMSLTLNPSTVTAGTATSVAMCIVSKDVVGNTIASGTYLDPNLAAPSFSASDNDSTGSWTVTTPSGPAPTCGKLSYSGAGSSPVMVTVTESALSASASMPAPTGGTTGTPQFAIVQTGGMQPFLIATGPGNPLLEYAIGSSSPLHQYTSSVGWLGEALDPAGVLWGDSTDQGGVYGSFIGFRPDGTSAGTINSTEYLLAFDASGKLYTSARSPSYDGADVRQYSVNGTTLTLLRDIASPCNGAGVYGAAADSTGTIYMAVTGCSTPQEQLFSFAAGNTSGNVTPTMSANGWYQGVGIDAANNIYSNDTSAQGMVVWSAGSFGASPPARLTIYNWPAANPLTTPPPSDFPESFAVLPDGSGCTLLVTYVGPHGFSQPAGMAFWKSPSGAIPTCPNYSGAGVIVGPAP